MPRACGLIPQGHWTRATPSSSLPPANNGDHGGAPHMVAGYLGCIRGLDRRRAVINPVKFQSRPHNHTVSMSKRAKRSEKTTLRKTKNTSGQNAPETLSRCTPHSVDCARTPRHPMRHLYVEMTVAWP